MNIQQPGSVDKANFTYSMNSLLQPQRERQAPEDRPAASATPETLSGAGPGTAPLPALGRYINVWA